MTTNYSDYLLTTRQEAWSDIIQYREYVSGEQETLLTDAQRELLVGEEGTSPEFALNICGTVLNAETDRLKIQGIVVRVYDEGSEDTEVEVIPQLPNPMDPAARLEQNAEKIAAEAPIQPTGEVLNQAESDRITRLIRKWWGISRMDEVQLGVHHTAGRDGDSYLISYFDKKRNCPKTALNVSYDGQTTGAETFYRKDDPTEKLAAVKIWELDGPKEEQKTFRKNVYYPNRIEYYIGNKMAGEESSPDVWKPLEPGDPDWDITMTSGLQIDPFGITYECTFIDWTEDGEDLGIPVAHFRRFSFGGPNGRSALADIVPGVQDVINQSSLSILAATLLTGFKVVWATKYDPNNGKFKVYPGAIVYNAEDGSFGQFQETDLKQLIEVKNSFIKDAAIITDTPLSFFNLGGDVPAAGTLRQMESSLLTKVEKDQISFGNAYEDMARTWLILEYVFGDKLEDYTLEQVMEFEITTEWISANIRDERLDAEIAAQHSELGVPDEEIWRKLGYNETKVAEFAVKKAQRDAEQMKRQQELQKFQEIPPRNGNGNAEKESQYGPNSQTGSNSLSTG